MTADKTNPRRDFIKQVGLTALGTIAAPYVFAWPASKAFNDDSSAKIILF